MEAQRLIIRSGQDLISVNGEPLSRVALIDQLEKIVESRHFRNSKRYPGFLRFVVEQTLSGNTEILKERTLGTEVFARPNDYDTNADPIVRVTAGEIRKRLAQYYQEPEHQDELRIDLPLGAYVPRFFGPGHPLPSMEEPPHKLASATATESPVQNDSGSFSLPVVSPSLLAHGQGNRRTLWLSLLTALLLVVGTAFAWKSLHNRTAEASVESVWRPMLASAHPALIIIGVHSLDAQGREEIVESHAPIPHDQPENMLNSMVRSDMVPVSDIVSYSQIADLLTRHTHPYATLGSTDATLDQMHNAPVILIGGLDNLWTLRLTSKLRFHFLERKQEENAIVDAQHPDQVWRFNNMQPADVNTHDYAIVASYFDATIDQPVIVIAGIGKTGTQVAAEFFTSDKYLEAWLRKSGDPAHRNIEILLSTDILDGKAGPPHVVASAVW